MIRASSPPPPEAFLESPPPLEGFLESPPPSEGFLESPPPPEAILESPPPPEGFLESPPPPEAFLQSLRCPRYLTRKLRPRFAQAHYHIYQVGVVLFDVAKMDGQEITKLSITTNTVVGDLPNEVLKKAFMRLRREALKNVRLTSRHWSELSAGLMFERIYFSPAKTVIENFTLITSNPLLCINITEVVYDARVFSLDNLSPQSIEKKREAFTEFFHEDSESNEDLWYEPLSSSELQQATDNLQRLYEEQQDILENAHDTKALVAGLRNLPRLEDLTIPRMVYCKSTITDEYPHRAYVTKLNKLISGAILPEDVLRLERFCCSGIQGAWQATQWSPQGIYHLFHVSSLSHKGFCSGGN